MTSLHLELELLSPVAISARSATLGGHETLTYVPGRQLLGATAAALGSVADADEVWRILFSGEVRFGDAWPAVDGRPAPFAPLSFHVPKGAADGPVLNLVQADRGERQLQQLRDVHVTADGRTVDPLRAHTLRTAIEEQGRAREGFLFGIEALAPGQRFLARIDADDPQLLDRVRACLDGRTIALGRSRGAELGEVGVRVTAPFAEPDGDPAGRELVLWLVADLLLRDPVTGAPRLALTPTDLGLDPTEWKLDEARTFVRTRRYSPFDTRRRRPDLERQVIQAGSVFVFEGPGLGPAASEALRERLRRGLGEHVEEGLGRAVVNPGLLATAEVRLAPWRGREAVGPSAPMPDDALGRWLGRRLARLERTAAAERAAHEWEAAFRSADVRPSQWSEIRRLAREARYRANGAAWLVGELERFLESGARLHTWPGAARSALLKRVKDEKASPELVEQAAARLSRRSEVER